ncbi:MAG: hypothetical protein M9904_12425 [Chitinophagaceae bacterium]|nr:hypothetical protein [Chitinophagaceae bacterium]
MKKFHKMLQPVSDFPLVPLLLQPGMFSAITRRVSGIHHLATREVAATV